MLQHLLRRLVFDVPILNEYAKMPLKVCLFLNYIYLFNLSHFYVILKNIGKHIHNRNWVNYSDCCIH